MTARKSWGAVLLPFLVGWSFFDPFHEHVEKGNAQAQSGENRAALDDYDKAATLDPGSPIPDFNRGIVLSKEGESQAARDALLSAAASEDAEIAADALYNLGNVLLDGEEYAPAVDAYLKSLDLDPDDEDARRNLEIAFRRLEEKKQEPQQEKKDESQEQKDQSEDQNEQKDDEQQGKQEEKDDEPKGEEEKEGSQEEKPPEPQDPGNRGEGQEGEGADEEPQPEAPAEDQLSREDAERLLNAIQSDELKVLQARNQSDEEAKGVVANDW